jgi:hypothetical protein
MKAVVEQRKKSPSFYFSPTRQLQALGKEMLLARKT